MYKCNQKKREQKKKDCIIRSSIGRHVPHTVHRIVCYTYLASLLKISLGCLKSCYDAAFGIPFRGQQCPREGPREGSLGQQCPREGRD